MSSICRESDRLGVTHAQRPAPALQGRAAGIRVPFWAVVPESRDACLMDADLCSTTSGFVGPRPVSLLLLVFLLSTFGMSPSVTTSVTLPPCLHLRVSALSRYPLPSSPPLPKSPLMSAFGLLILVIMFSVSRHSIWLFFMFLVFQSILFFRWFDTQLSFLSL